MSRCSGARSCRWRRRSRRSRGSESLPVFFGAAGPNVLDLPRPSQSAGVIGRSEVFSGVLGQSGVNPQAPAVDPAGVVGLSSLGTTGVLGESIANAGVRGHSVSGAGLEGISQNSIGVFGRTVNPASFAGKFDGDVEVDGNLQVNNVKVANTLTAFLKNAVVRFPDGSLRVLHCMESPEHWFEDFGSGKLSRGRASVKLDADFAKVITNDYCVFLTPGRRLQRALCDEPAPCRVRSARTRRRQVECGLQLPHRRAAQGHRAASPLRQGRVSCGNAGAAQAATAATLATWRRGVKVRSFLALRDDSSDA